MIPYVEPEIIQYLDELYPDKAPDLSMEEKLLTKAKGISKGVLRQAEKVLAENLLAEFGLGAKVEET